MTIDVKVELKDGFNDLRCGKLSLWLWKLDWKIDFITLDADSVFIIINRNSNRLNLWLLIRRWFYINHAAYVTNCQPSIPIFITLFQSNNQFHKFGVRIEP